MFDSKFNRGCVCIGGRWLGLNLKVSGVDSAGKGNDNNSNCWRLVDGGGGEVGQGQRSMQQRP